MKKIPFLLLSMLLLIIGCSTNKPASSDNTVKEQAKAYSVNYLGKVSRLRPAIIKYHDNELENILYLDVHIGLIGIEEYSRSPYQQFLDLLNNNPSISYTSAVERVTYDRTNYFADDCPSINTFLSSLNTRELKLSSSNHSILENRITYEYINEENNNPSYYHYITATDNHPVALIYSEALKEIENCPHPKDPPKFD